MISKKLPRPVGPCRRRLALARLAAAVESLESRQLMCSEHGAALTHMITDAAERTANAAATDHNAAWYQPVGTVAPRPGVAGRGSGDQVPDGVTFSVNAAGLPLLTSRTDGGLKVFLDFDGYGTDTPFSTDADGTTFNASEQVNIYDTWRDIVSYFAPLNVNITTVQPPVGGSNPAFVWHRISNSIQGGAAYVGWFTNERSNSWTGQDGGTTRHSGVAHEIGHQLGLSHQAEHDALGVETHDYTDGFGSRDRSIIGVDYAENVRRWFFGRNSDNVLNLQDDLAVMAGTLSPLTSSDGYRPDDFGATMPTAQLVPAGGMIGGIIERSADVDLFRFNASTTGRHLIAATPTFESSVSPKIELVDASGNLIAARDDADQRNTNNNGQEFSVNLAPGTYYVRVMSSGDYAEQGEYLLTAAPLPGGWSSQDVGAATIFRAGTASFDPVANKLTQIGGGGDIWNTYDEFRFTSNTLNGNGSITARIDQLDNVDQHTKAGVMIRASMAPNSAHVFVGIKPSGQLDPIVRTTAGGVAAAVGNPAGVTGPWVRLTRAGNLFTVERSADGVNWTTQGTTTVAMGTSVQIGFATNARYNRGQAYSTFSNITVTGNLGVAAPTYNSLAAPANLTVTPAAGATTTLSLAWSGVSGAVGYVLERSADGVTFDAAVNLGTTLTSTTWAGLFGSMRYFFRVSALAADSTRSAPSVTASGVNKPSAPTNPNGSYAQPIIRLNPNRLLLNWTDVQGDNGYKIERSTAGGAFATIATTGKNQTAFNDDFLTPNTSYLYRVTPVTSIGDTIAPPWTVSATTPLAAPSNFRMASRTTDSATLAWTDMTGESGYRLEQSTDATTWSAVTDLAANATGHSVTGLAPLTRYYFRLRALDAGNIPGAETITFGATAATTSLPANWTGVDVGAVPGPGASAGTLAGDWTVIASGADIWGTSDQFHYVSRSVTGDGSITARLTALDETDTYVKGGVMFRESMAANSPYFFMHYSAGPGLQVEYRGSTGAASGNTFILASAARWLRVTRVGNLFTAQYSTDGATWTTAATRSIAMANSARAGLAATSHNTSRMTLATFDNVTTTGTSLNTAPTITAAAAATPTPVTGNTTSLSVTATDDGGLAGLSYAWSVVSKPAGVADPIFGANHSNAARLSTATFAAAGNYTLRVTVTDAQGLAVTSDVAVAVTLRASAAFEWDKPQQQLVVQFNGNVDSTLAAADLILTNTTTGAVFPAGQISRSFNATTNVATFTFTTTANGALPDGSYTATILAGTVAEPSGLSLAADVTLSLFSKAGDVNHSGTVDFDDLVILAQNYGSTGRVFSAGNLNYDAAGNVDFDDLVILAQHYNTSVPSLASIVSPAPAIGGGKSRGGNAAGVIV